MTFRNIHIFRPPHPVWHLVVLLILVGCNSKTGLYELTGTVQLENEAVPAGMIILSPDRTKGNSGSQGLAEISEGRIIRTRRPVVGGPYWIEVHAFDGVAYEGGEGTVSSGKRLIPILKTQIDLPESDVELTIAIQKQPNNIFVVGVEVKED